MPYKTKKIVMLLLKPILDSFSSSEWTEIGFLTGTDDYIQNHPRLLRSLSWGDDDYKGHAINAIEYIIDSEPGNLNIIANYDPIVHWFSQHKSEEYTSLTREIRGLELDFNTPSTKNNTVLDALADAQVLLRTRGPVSAVDRMHTALHGYLKTVCEQFKIETGDDPTANKLLKLLIENHPALQKLGPRTEDIKNILRTSGAIIDAFGTIRNQASLVHPNEELLDKEEALFVMNIARSILQLFDSKIPPIR